MYTAELRGMWSSDFPIDAYSIFCTIQTTMKLYC